MSGEGFPSTERQEIEGQVTFEELEEGKDNPRNQVIEKIQSAMERSDLNDMAGELNAQFKDDKELEAIFNKRRETIKNRDKLYHDIGFDSYEEMKKKVKNAINDPDFTKEDRIMIARRVKHRMDYEKGAREREATIKFNDESGDMEPAGEFPSVEEEKNEISAVDEQLIRDMHKAGDEGYSDSYITGGDDGFNMPKTSFETTDVADDSANADEEKTASDTDVQNVSEGTNDYEQKFKEYHEEMERLRGELQDILGRIDELKKKYESFGIDTSSEDNKNNDENKTTENETEDATDKQKKITDDIVNAVMSDDEDDAIEGTVVPEEEGVSGVVVEDGDENDKQKKITDDIINAVMSEDEEDGAGNDEVDNLDNSGAGLGAEKDVDIPNMDEFIRNLDKYVKMDEGVAFEDARKKAEELYRTEDAVWSDDGWEDFIGKLEKRFNELEVEREDKEWGPRRQGTIDALEAFLNDSDEEGAAKEEGGSEDEENVITETGESNVEPDTDKNDVDEAREYVDDGSELPLEEALKQCPDSYIFSRRVELEEKKGIGFYIAKMEEAFPDSQTLVGSRAELKKRFILKFGDNYLASQVKFQDEEEYVKSKKYFVQRFMGAKNEKDSVIKEIDRLGIDDFEGVPIETIRSSLEYYYYMAHGGSIKVYNGEEARDKNNAQLKGFNSEMRDKIIEYAESRYKQLGLDHYGRRVEEPKKISSRQRIARWMKGKIMIIQGE